MGLIWTIAQDEKDKQAPIRSMPKIKSKWKPLKPCDWPNYKHADLIAIDTETKDPSLLTHGAGYATGNGHIIGISAAISKTESVYLPMRHEVEGHLNCDPEKVLLWAKDNLTTDAVKIGANIQYDVGWLRREGVNVGGTCIDVLIAEALIDENKRNYNLDRVARKYLKQGKVSEALYVWCAKFYGGEANGTQRKNMYRTPPQLAGPYAEADAWQPYEIWKHQDKIVQAQGLERVHDIECRLMPMLIDMRMRGVRVDLDYFYKLYDKFEKIERKAQKKLNKIAGEEINVYAAESIERAFLKHHMPYGRTQPSDTHPEGQPSFTGAFLKNCNTKMTNLIQRVKEINKLRVTFIQNAILDKHHNGRVHCEYRQVKGSVGGTESGRLSAANPNLTQVPSRTEDGKRIRKGFIPDEGFTHWYRGDTNQVEYRFLAHYAVGKGADTMRGMYMNDPDTDFHEATSELILNITNIDLDRKPTKTINFGLTYGMGKPKLKASLGVDDKTGEKLFQAYHEGVPFVDATFQHFMEEALNTGVIQTILGRRSRFEQWEQPWGNVVLNSAKKALKKWGPGNFQRAYCHKALNRKLQGSAADHLKAGMVAIYESGVLDRLGGPPALNVHDELDGSCNFPEHKEELREMKRIMENVLTLRVPLVVDYEIGTNWGNAKGIKL